MHKMNWSHRFKKILEMFISGFPQTQKIIPCTRTIICNTCEQTNVLGDILNSVGNVDDQEDYCFTESSSKISPIVI